MENLNHLHTVKNDVQINRIKDKLAPFSHQFLLKYNVIPAHNEVLVRHAKRLRHQIYCFESKQCNDYGRYVMMEEDKYDKHALYILIQEKKTGLFVAAVRLVLPDPSNPNDKLPMETDGFVGASVAERFGFKREGIAEISHLALASSLKTQAGESDTISGISANITTQNYVNAKDGIPHISIVLFASTLIQSVEYGITHLYAYMEPSLFRLLVHYGMKFTPVGPIKNNYVRQIPAIINVRQTLLAIKKGHPDMVKLIMEIERSWKAFKKQKSVDE